MKQNNSFYFGHLLKVCDKLSQFIMFHKKNSLTLYLLIVLFFALLPSLILPEDQSNNIYRVLEGHKETVTSVAFSPAFSPYSEVIASGSNDKTVRIWDLKTGELKRTFEGFIDEVKSIAFSPNGRILACVSWNGNVRLWNMISGELVLCFEHKVVYRSENGLSLKNAILWSVAISPDGKMIATGGQYRKNTSGLVPISKSWAGTIKFWEALTGNLLRTLEWQEDAVYSVAFSPDGKIFASGSADKTVQLWDLRTNGPLKTLEGHTEAVYSIAFSRDNKYLVSGSGDGNAIIWDVQTGNIVKKLEGHKGAILSVAYSPNGKMIASGGRDNIVRLWNALTGELISTFEGHTNSVTDVVFSPDSEILASSSVDKTIILWKIK
ncbi:MAG: WD40 repeat domain-containing protein [bacterium]